MEVVVEPVGVVKGQEQSQTEVEDRCYQVKVLIDSKYNNDLSSYHHIRYLNANNEAEPDLSSFSFYINFLNVALDSAGSAQELFEAEPGFQKVYYMMMMTVEPGYRGRGIASQLITSCFEVTITLHQHSRRHSLKSGEKIFFPKFLISHMNPE